MKSPDTGKPIPEEILIACNCAIRDYPHYHGPELTQWLKQVWANDLKGDGHSSTENTFPPLKAKETTDDRGRT